MVPTVTLEYHLLSSPIPILPFVEVIWKNLALAMTIIVL